MVDYPTAGVRRAPLRKLVLLMVAALLVSIGATAATASVAKADPLQGTIPFTTGGTTGSPPSGSWVHLCQIASPFGCFANTKSLDTSDDTYTPIKASATGLSLNGAQAEASPAFDEFGNSLSKAIVSPRAFGTPEGFANFGLWTSSTPTLSVTGTAASVSPQAITAASIPLVVDWAGTSGYQTPATTANLTGQVVWNTVGNPANGGTITLDWTVPITNSPVNQFEGYSAQWHITGPLVW